MRSLPGLHWIEEWQFDQEILSLQRINRRTILQNAYFLIYFLFPGLIFLWQDLWFQPRVLLDCCLSFSTGVVVVNLLLYLSVPRCLLSFFQWNTPVLNLSEKPDEIIQVPYVVNCGPFFPCGIPHSLFLADNAQVFCTRLPVPGSVYVCPLYLWVFFSSTTTYCCNWCYSMWN